MAVWVCLSPDEARALPPGILTVHSLVHRPLLARYEEIKKGQLVTSPQPQGSRISGLSLKKTKSKCTTWPR